MKIKLTQEQIDSIMEDPQKAQEAGVKTSDPWWVIVLKVISYIIGLLLGGTLITSCVPHLM